MLENAGLVIIGQKVTLVPYEREHVPKYHAWMTDPWLQETTASEPLTMDEELAMQRTWREGPKKCTFIVLEKGGDDRATSFVSDDAISRMAGDVNLFFNDDEDESVCEIEIMIAESKHRRKGFAREALQLMMAYATRELKVTRFYCKIHETNEASLALFDSLGYQKCNYVKAFEEFELEFFPRDHLERTVNQVLKTAVFLRTDAENTNT